MEDMTHTLANGERHSVSRSRSSTHSRHSRSRSGASYSQSPRDRKRSPSRSPAARYNSRRDNNSPMSHRRRHFGNRDNPEPSKCLGVFGLNFRTRERDLYDLFDRYGDIEDITLVMDTYTGRSRGFAFVYFKHIEDAKAAKEECHGMTLDSRQIRVDFSVTERAHTPTPGVYLGKSSHRQPTRRGDDRTFNNSRRKESYHRSSRRSRSRSPHYHR